jgi:hypothetical protein
MKASTIVGSAGVWGSPPQEANNPRKITIMDNLKDFIGILFINSTFVRERSIKQSSKY